MNLNKFYLENPVLIVFESQNFLMVAYHTARTTSFSDNCYYWESLKIRTTFNYCCFSDLFKIDYVVVSSQN